MTLAQDLESLEQMRNRGALSEAEFAQAKDRLLHGTAPSPISKVSALNFTGLDAWLWRLAFTLTLILAGTGLFVYLLMWILVPVEPLAHPHIAPSN